MQTVSIARRLHMGLIASLLVAAAVLGIVATLLFERALREYALNLLHQDAQSVLAAIEQGPQGMALDTTRLAPSYHRPLAGRYFIVEIAGARWRSRSLWDSTLWEDTAQSQASLPTTAGAVEGLIDGPEGQRLLCLRVDYRRYGTDVVVVVAADVAPLLTEFRSIGMVLVVLVATTVLLLVWLQQLWMRRALSPLAQAQQQLKELQQGQRELLDARAPPELQPLITEINRLLQFTRQSLQRSRQALGNLGHSLKTPLAVLISLADRAEPTLRGPLQEQLTQIQHRIVRELGRARMAGDVVPGTWFVPQQDLPLLVESLRLAHADAPAIDWRAPLQAVPLERDDMLELLGNLLDNACKWARHRIALDIEIDTDSGGASHLVTRLQDDGPGIAEALRERVLERGSRLDERIEGHGLGLGIVSNIVAAYDGDIALAQSPLGGLQISVRLPLGAPRQLRADRNDPPGSRH